LIVDKRTFEYHDFGLKLEHAVATSDIIHKTALELHVASIRLANAMAVLETILEVASLAAASLHVFDALAFQPALPKDTLNQVSWVHVQPSVPGD